MVGETCSSFESVTGQLSVDHDSFEFLYKSFAFASPVLLPSCVYSAKETLKKETDYKLCIFNKTVSNCVVPVLWQSLGQRLKISQNFRRSNFDSICVVLSYCRFCKVLFYKPMDFYDLFLRLHSVFNRPLPAVVLLLPVTSYLHTSLDNIIVLDDWFCSI